VFEAMAGARRDDSRHPAPKFGLAAISQTERKASHPETDPHASRGMTDKGHHKLVKQNRHAFQLFISSAGECQPRILASTSTVALRRALVLS